MDGGSCKHDQKFKVELHLGYSRSSWLHSPFVFPLSDVVAEPFVTCKDVLTVPSKPREMKVALKRAPQSSFPDVPLVLEPFTSGPWHASTAKGHVVSM